MGKALAELNLLPQKEIAHDFHFLSYAREQCFFHLSHTSEGPQHANLLLKLLHQNRLGHDLSVARSALLFWAAEHGNGETLTILCQYPVVELNAQNDHGRTLLHLAVIGGNTAAVKYLLSDPTVDANIRDNYGWTALVGAISHGHQAACEADRV